MRSLVVDLKRLMSVKASLSKVVRTLKQCIQYIIRLCHVFCSDGLIICPFLLFLSDSAFFISHLMTSGIYLDGLSGLSLNIFPMVIGPLIMPLSLVA